MAAARPGDEVTDWSSRPRAIRVLVVLTGLGVILALVGGGLMAFGDKLPGGGGDTSDRQQVISRAKDFAVTYNTYDVADKADYQKRLKGLLTEGYNKQFVEVTDAIFTALADKKQTSGDAKVLGVAIDSIDDDSAEAIVAVDASITNTDNKAAVERHFRWKLSFVKTKDDWLVSNFESVAAVGAERAAPSASPGAGGTQGGGDK